MRMPATGTILLLIAIWILVNLFVGDLPKLILDKSNISINPTPVPVPEPQPNPSPAPNPDPQFHPNPFPRPDWEIPQPSGSCPPGYVSVLGMCVPEGPTNPSPKPAPNPFPIPLPKLPFPSIGGLIP